MSTFRNPVGPQPSSVYWRRRLVVGLGLLAVIVIIILIVARPGSGTPSPTPKPTTSAGPSSTPAATNAAGDVECDPSKVTLEAVTDATSYEAGVLPQLSFTLKSIMGEPCMIEAGSDLQEFRITSGDELIWSSRDCQTGEVAASVELKPGVPFPGSSLQWDRTRSSTDTCDVPREPVIAGGASYHLEVSIGDLESKSTKQFLLF